MQIWDPACKNDPTQYEQFCTCITLLVARACVCIRDMLEGEATATCSSRHRIIASLSLSNTRCSKRQLADVSRLSLLCPLSRVHERESEAHPTHTQTLGRGADIEIRYTRAYTPATYSHGDDSVERCCIRSPNIGTHT